MLLGAFQKQAPKKELCEIKHMIVEVKNSVKVLKDKIKKKSVKNTLPNKLLLFKYEGKIKGFPEKEKLRKFINTKSSLQ